MGKVSEVCGGAFVMLKNEYGIKEIIMYPKVICYCPLGNDWYSNSFEVYMKVKQSIPDYCEIEKWLDKNMRGKSLIIEDAIEMFYKYLSETYSPIAIEVSSYVEDAKHFPVRVKR